MQQFRQTTAHLQIDSSSFDNFTTKEIFRSISKSNINNSINEQNSQNTQQNLLNQSSEFSI